MPSNVAIPAPLLIALATLFPIKSISISLVTSIVKLKVTFLSLEPDKSPI